MRAGSQIINKMTISCKEAQRPLHQRGNSSALQICDTTKTLSVNLLSPWRFTCNVWCCHKFVKQLSPLKQREDNFFHKPTKFLVFGDFSALFFSIFCSFSLYFLLFWSHFQVSKSKIRAHLKQRISEDPSYGLTQYFIHWQKNLSGDTLVYDQ